LTKVEISYKYIDITNYKDGPKGRTSVLLLWGSAQCFEKHLVMGQSKWLLQKKGETELLVHSQSN
jgi:hypothetical protein